MNNVQPPPLSYRLSVGQRVTITSPFNAACAQIGTTGTIVKMPEEFAGGSLSEDDFWERWEEQFVALDGNASSDGLPACIRRGHMAPIEEGDQSAVLRAIEKVRFRLLSTTQMVLDRLLRGEPLDDGDADVVEHDCNTVWRESGRRRETTTKRLAAHEAVEHFLKGSYETALRAAEFAMPRPRRARS